MQINCLIVDDEPPARDVIKRYITELPLLQFCGECGNAIQALTILQQQPIDLIFLDIRMPQLNGTDLLKTLKHRPKVIFTTAYAEYALEGYELDIVDYLMKPIRFERFVKAINKAFPLLPMQQVKDVLQFPQKEEEAFVYFRAERKMIKVLLDEIVYIESMKDYVKVITKNKTIITRQSITLVEAMLPENKFIRTHRSFIISIDKIKSFTSESIKVENTEVPIGKLYRNGVLKTLT